MQQIIDWFEIPVRDITSAQNFYETVLQTRLHREEYAGPGLQMAVFAGEGDVVKSTPICAISIGPTAPENE